MTATDSSVATNDQDRFVAWAAALGATAGQYTAEHDRDGTFVTEAFDCLRSEGYLALAVPTELGGHGATPRQVCMAQRQLAQHCASTALSSVMHQHLVLFTAWRYRRGLPGAEATLRRVADEGIVLVSTGGADQTRPRGEAKRVEGGYTVSGRKIFASQSPVGAVLSTMFPLTEPDGERVVLNMSVPLNADGVTVLPTWDSLGMRGTGSNDIELHDVFVPEERVLARRPYGKIDPPLQVVYSLALPAIAAVYLGVAEAARSHALHALKETPRADDPIVQRHIGLMNSRLQIASWALDGALAMIGDNPEPSMDNVTAALIAKREIALAGLEVCDVAMEVAGGAAFYKGSPLERCYRDIRGVKFHPYSPEQTLQHVGGSVLGLAVDEV